MTHHRYEVTENHNGRSGKGVVIRDAPSRDDYADTSNTQELRPGDTFVANESVANAFPDRVKVVEEDVEPEGDSDYVKPSIERGDADQQAAAARAHQSSTADYGEGDDADPEARREGEADSQNQTSGDGDGEGDSGN